MRAPWSPLLRAACALVLCATMLVACSDNGGPTIAQKTERVGTVLWKPCDNVQCATLRVPLDWRHPRGRTISLALARRPASGRRVGTLFTNPGGPGGSGVAFVKAADSVFPSGVRNAFDIVSWDPRGVGASTPVNCLDDLDPFYAVDHTPDTPAEVQANVAATHAFVDACKRRSGSLLPFVSTVASVRDMDAIRAALGEPTISYIGFSYGTLLGARYAAAYPHHVRAMVLDGAVDPSLSYTQTTVDQARSFDADLDGFLTHCRDDGCGFAEGGDPFRAFTDLQASIDNEPVPATAEGESRTLGPGEFDIGVASALYGGHDSWSELGAALAQAARGSGNRMLKLFDDYTERAADGSYSNETAALYATSCLDGPAPTSLNAMEQLAAAAARSAPVFGASTAWLGLPCTYWPVAPETAAAPVHAPDAPPLLVVGAIHDPATPYAWAQGLSRQLGTAHLLTVDGDSHTSYGRGDGCVDRAVDEYLLELTVPAADARCS